MIGNVLLWDNLMWSFCVTAPAVSIVLTSYQQASPSLRALLLWLASLVPPKRCAGTKDKSGLTFVSR
jgi:hypothetical protein